MTLLSFCIVNWNTKDLLRQCLESILTTTGELPHEVIVVDNASEDGSQAMLRKDFPSVRLIENTANLGFAIANNQALGIARGRYLCLVNSDVLLQPGCIETLLAHLEARPQAGMIGPRVLNADGTLQPSCLGEPTVWNTLCRTLGLDTLFPRSPWFNGLLLRHWDYQTMREVDVLVGCFWLVRRAAVDAVGPLDESFFMYSEDMDWCTRFRRAGWTILFDPAAEIIHYGGGSSARQPVRFYAELKISLVRYWRKFHGRPGAWYMTVLLLVHEGLRILGFGALRLVRPAREERNRLRFQQSVFAFVALAKLLCTGAEPGHRTRQ